MIDMRASGRLAAAVLLASSLTACGATMKERHFFASSINPTTNQIDNVIRLRVSGTVGMTNARYLAGFYDERAVDLFFNEVKATDLAEGSGRTAAPAFFTTTCEGSDAAACAAAGDARLATIPSGAGTSNGAFVLLMSTNADAIASTIGSFAENTANMEAALFLATRDTRQDAARLQKVKPIVAASRASTYAEVSSLFTAATDQAAPMSSADRDRAYLAMLRALAAGLNRDSPPAFTTIDEARTWFASQPRSLRP